MITSSMFLLLGLATAHTGEDEAFVPVAVHVLSLMVLKGSYGLDYLYFRTPPPDYRSSSSSSCSSTLVW